LPIPPDLEAALFHGSSIGGARPKATVAVGTTKYIAKFSLSTDDYDMVGAEFLAMRLAHGAGIETFPSSGAPKICTPRQFSGVEV